MTGINRFTSDTSVIQAQKEKVDEVQAPYGNLCIQHLIQKEYSLYNL